MKIYYPIPDSDHFDRLNLLNTGDWQVLQTLIGNQLSDVWNPLPVEVDSIGQPSDFPSLFGHQLVCSEKAWQVLAKLIGNHVEALPLECSDAKYFVLNVLNVLNAEVCLDTAHSVIDRFSDGRIMHIKAYVFRDETIANKDIFQLHQTYDILVSQTFREIVEKNSLQGLIFRQVSG